MQILPCSDSEVGEIVRGLVKEEDFASVVGYVFGENAVEGVVERLKGCRSVEELQRGVMYEAIEHIMTRTMSGFECYGMEQLEGEGRHVFVANHRDIILDAFLLQYALLREGMNTTRIVIGANLIFHPLMSCMARLNKMLTIERGGGRREFYEELRRVSEYIRCSIVGAEGESVWIAQRNGRTKDGDDRTDEAVVKMLAMSGGDDVIEALDSLHITPVSISYEIEPCDGLKAKELTERERLGVYEKEEGEDRRSVLAGIMQNKGRVVMRVCKPLQKAELMKAYEEGPAAYYRNVAALIDSRITENYELMKTNEEAYMLQNGGTTDDDDFVRHIEEQSRLGADREAMRAKLLSIYATPYRKVKGENY